MSYLNRLLPFIGLFLLTYIIQKVGWENILETLGSLNYSYLFLAFLFIIPVMLIQTYKWFIITKKQGINVSFAECVKMQLIGIFYGFITPFRIGSFMKIAYLQKTVKNIGKSSSSVVIDRALDLLAVSILASFGSMFIASRFSYAIKWIWIFLFTFIVFLFTFLHEKTAMFLAKIFYIKSIQGRFRNAEKYLDSFYNSIPSYKFLAYAFIINIATWIMIYTQVFFAAKAVNIDVPYILLITIVPISTIIALIPVSIAGLGTREAALVTLFSFFNIEPAKVVTMSLLSVLIASLIPAIIGFFLSLSYKHLRHN